MKVSGIGGAFIYSNNPKALAEWYSKHLGIELASDEPGGTYYTETWYRDPDDPAKKPHAIFAIMPAAEPLGPPGGGCMINFWVEDLASLAEQLRQAGIPVEPIAVEKDAEGYGKFTHMNDPEGNRIELWQPSSQKQIQC